jgi:hypothetical protein
MRQLKRSSLLACLLLFALLESSAVTQLRPLPPETNDHAYRQGDITHFSTTLLNQTSENEAPAFVIYDLNKADVMSEGGLPDVSRPSKVEELEGRLNSVRAERTRWERVIAIEADLAQDPKKLASKVYEAAEELKSEGRSLTVEGLTLGLSGLFKMAAELLPKSDWRSKKKLEDIGVGIEASHKLFIKDMVAGKKESDSAKKLLDQGTSTLELFLRTLNKKEREEMEALLSIAAPVTELVIRMVSGKPISWKDEETLSLAKDFLVGVRAMMLAVIQHRNPQQLVGFGRALVVRYPKIAKILGVLATKGLVATNLVNSVAIFGVGAYIWREGIGLTGVADDIRDNQLRAGVILKALLPHAVQARRSALRREARLERMIQSLKSGSPPAPKLIPPSSRVIDDGIGTPPRLYFGLKATLTVLQSSPPLTYQLTKREERRREEIARAERAAEEQRRRAARVAAERAQREQSRRESPSGDSNSRQGADLSGARERIERVVNNVLRNW